MLAAELLSTTKINFFLRGNYYENLSFQLQIGVVMPSPVTATTTETGTLLLLKEEDSQVPKSDLPIIICWNGHHHFVPTRGIRQSEAFDDYIGRIFFHSEQVG